MTHPYRPLRAACLMLAGTALASASALAQEITARVVQTTAVTQQVAVPRQICTNQPVIQQSQPSGAGALMGAIAGGTVGHALGNGVGKEVATMLGVFGGTILGNKVEGTRDEVRNMQQCSTQTSYENRVLHYDVVYEHEGKRYSIKMPNDPGQFVRLQLSPVGALTSQTVAPASAPAATIYTPISSEHRYEPTPTVTYVQPAPVYVAPPPVVYPAVRYGHQPYVAPISLSLGWSSFRGGHGHGHGHGHHHGGHGFRGHWR